MKTLEERFTEWKQFSIDHPIIPCGFIDMDLRGGFLHRGALSLLGGRPGMGKTTLALQIALNVARANKTVAYFAPDSQLLETAERLFNYSADFDWAGLPLYLDDRTFNVKQMCNTVLALKRKPDLIIVDLLQSTRLVSRRGTSYYDAGEICRMLKNLALSTGGAVLCLTNVSRDPERSKNKAPLPSDIPQWEKIAPHMDSLCLIFRDSYYRNNFSSTEDDFAQLIMYRTGGSMSTAIGWDRKHGCFVPFSDYCDDC